MSHQSGIVVCRELQERFSEALAENSSVRMLQINIVEEALVESSSSDMAGTWQDDYDSAILPLLDETKASYFVFRSDTKNAYGPVWHFICWVPDHTPVREKMLYASTRATLRRAFGDYRIGDEVFGTCEADVTLDGLEKHRESREAPAPLTAREEEAQEIKRAECGSDIGASTRKTTHSGVAFPLTDAAQGGVAAFKAEQSNYLQLLVDTDAETIDLDKVDDFDVEELEKNIPSDHPRYHLYRYKHIHEGESQKPVLFVYSCPGFNTKIKERMLYSSCRNTLIDELEQEYDIAIDKRVEIGEASDVNAEAVEEEFHPRPVEAKKKFSRPKAPSKRGPRKLLRTEKEASDTPDEMN